MARTRVVLDDRLISRIARYVRDGLTIRTIAQNIGVSEATITRWLRLGRKGEANPLYAELVDAVDRAREEREELGGPMDLDELLLVASRRARIGDVQWGKVALNILTLKANGGSRRREEEPRIFGKMDELAAKRAAARGRRW